MIIDRFRSLVRRSRSIYCVLRYRLKNVGRGFLAGKDCDLSRDLITGDWVYIGPRSIVYPGVRIGSYSMFGPEVKVMGRDHQFEIVGVPTIFAGRPGFKETVIGKDVWVGAGAFVRCGVSIGDFSIIAAGAVVLDDVPPFSIVVGVPGKVKRMRFRTENDRDAHRNAVNCGKVRVSFAEKIGASAPEI